VFEAKRPHAKFHDRNCAKRAQRHPDLAGTAKPKPKGRVRAQTRLADATVAELEAGGKLGTSAGITAMVLAERIDAGAETVAALAAAAAAHARAMDRALSGVAADDPVAALRDEVADRRDQHMREAR